MDYKKIFIKDAKPTPIGGQAIMDGVMMRGEDRTAIAVRLPDGRIYLKTEKMKPKSAVGKIPFVRGVYSFFASLVLGMKTLMKSADILEKFLPEDELENPGRLEQALTRKFGERAVWNFMMAFAVAFSVVISVACFIIFPTVAVNYIGKFLKNSIVLNLIEGVFRIMLFVLYVLLIRKTQDVKTLFRYHGAEHKTIHCFENGLELTPENAREFYTLHPRCGTSFLMFVFIISLLLFSLLGWPNVWMRILSRLLLLPVIAGISYELLKWAGRSDNAAVRVLSFPGLMMQRLTTAEPTDEQLEVAIVSLKAVLVDKKAPVVEGFADKDANIIEKADLLSDGEGAGMVLNRDTAPVEAASDEAAEGAVDEEAAETVDEEIAEAGDEEAVAADEEADETAGMTGTFQTAGTAAEKRRPEGDTIMPWPELSGKRYSDDVSMVRNAVRTGQKMLKDKPNGDREALDLFCYVMGWTRSEIVTRSRELLSEDDVRAYFDRIDLRLSGVPMQYIVKVQEFMGLPFKVNPNVLIPRLDTEVLVEQVIGMINGKGWTKPAILDVCAGSGAIGISLAHEFPDAAVTMTDISPEAIATAKENAAINETTANCRFLTGNMFMPVPEGEMFDVIVSNPPYIRSDVIETLDTEVKDHEPRLALDGGDDGLDAYRTIALESWKYLRGGGVLALEIGHDQADAVSLLLEISKKFNQPAVIRDLNGLDRVIIVERKQG